jgi:acetyl esterase/lipase
MFPRTTHDGVQMNAGDVQVEARRVPVPDSISPQAQALLRRLVGDYGTPVNATRALPAFDDHAAWRQLQAGVAQHYASVLSERARQVKAALQTVQVGHAPVHVATPTGPCDARHAYIDLHGGALVFGGGPACRIGAGMQADLLGLTCYGVDYRMPPDHPFPAALDDSLACYRYVLERHAPEHIVIGGRSAGGNLAVAMTLRARSEGLPMPAALVLLSPELDLTESGDSFQVNRTVDVVLPGSLMQANLLYAAGADLAHPDLSPLFGDFDADFPATFLQSGTRDLFLSNAVRLHRALRRAGALSELHVFEAMPHGGFMDAPEDEELSAEVVRFVRGALV